MSDSRFLVYVSCGRDQEIRTYSMGPETGELSLQGAIRLPVAREAELEGDLPMAALRTSGAPLAVSPDGATLYASLRSPPSRVASYRIDAQSGSLDLLRLVAIPASAPYIGTDRSGQFLIGAAYIGNLVWVARTEPDGRVSTQPFETVEGIVTPHSVLVHPNNRFAYVAATGHDEILTFHFDDMTGKLTRTGNPGEKAIEGATPRHMALHPDMQFLFCMNETSGIIDSFRVDPESGELTHVQSVDPRPPEDRDKHGIGADLHLTPDGRFLYGSSRASGTISSYEVDAATGGLSFVETVAAGKIPRSFAIDPSGRFLIAAGQGSDDLTMFAVDRNSGRLSKIASLETGGGPIWVEIVESGRQFA